MTRSMTYDEIALTFRIERETARRLVARKRWARRKGNDGKARVDVPLEALEEARTIPANEPANEPVTYPVDRPADEPATYPANDPAGVQALARVIERLESELAELRPKAAERDFLASQVETLRQERDAERQKASERDVFAVQVETLKVALEEARQERDRWAVQAHALAHPPAPAPDGPSGRLSWRWWWRRAG
jgi:hypothetical protein